MVSTNLDKLEQFLSVFDKKTLREEDFKMAFDRVIELLQKILERQQKFEAELHGNNSQFKEMVQNEVKLSLNDLKKQTNELFVGGRLTEMSTEQKKLFNSLKKEANDMFGKRMDSMLKEIKLRAVKGDQGNPGKGLPPTREQIVAIVAPVVDKFKEEMTEKSRTDKARGNAIGMNVNALQVHIVSDQFNGVTRKFNMPTASRVVKFEMSQAPFNLYEDTPTEVHGFSTGPHFIRLHDTVPAPQAGQSGAVYFQK